MHIFLKINLRKIPVVKNSQFKIYSHIYAYISLYILIYICIYELGKLLVPQTKAVIIKNLTLTYFTEVAFIPYVTYAIDINTIDFKTRSSVLAWVIQNAHQLYEKD